MPKRIKGINFEKDKMIESDSRFRPMHPIFKDYSI
jgi:hypothetical protein